MPELAPSEIRNVSDTALWVAIYRAQETERSDALFRDPFARRLAGERGAAIAASAKFMNRNAWSMVARTLLFDQVVLDEIANGTRVVVNLAAGLDTRPYRMALPKSLRWIEVDLPPMLDYKEQILADAQPVCQLERVRLDLTDVGARRGLFASLGSPADRVLVLTEGLLVYLTPEAAASLGRDLAAAPAVSRWAIDIANPALLKLMQRRMGKRVEAAGAPFQFGPAEGPEFFAPSGWQTLASHSLLSTAKRLHRLPWNLRLFTFLPQPDGPQTRQPWSGVCLLERVRA